jgi:hypothetical protein
MKNIYLIGFFISGFLMNLKSQATEINLQMSQGVQSGISVNIPEIESKVIERIWKRYTKGYGKLVKVKKSNEQLLQNASIPSIYGDNKMDVYSLIENNMITVFFDLKEGYINSKDHPDKFAAAKDFLEQFSFEVQREVVKEELEKEQDGMKKLNHKMSDLIKDHKEYLQDIEDAKARIKKAENNIIQNEKEQEQMKAGISDQSKVLERVQIKFNKIGKPQ